jgi:pilus assembly protein Flp/PilA
MANSHSRLVLFQNLSRVDTDEHGATATEYGLLTAFIAIAIVAGVGAFGTALNLYFGQLSAGVRAALGIP